MASKAKIARAGNFPAEAIVWRDVQSSNVEKVGWLPSRMEGKAMFVKFKSGFVYTYLGVSRQRVVAASRAKSVGKYINEKIKPEYDAIRVVGL